MRLFSIMHSRPGEDDRFELNLSLVELRRSMGQVADLFCSSTINSIEITFDDGSSTTVTACETKQERP
jgi:hypothetical protein